MKKKSIGGTIEKAAEISFAAKQTPSDGSASQQ
jgi:hypothetical protein